MTIRFASGLWQLSQWGRGEREASRRPALRGSVGRRPAQSRAPFRQEVGTRGTRNPPWPSWRGADSAPLTVAFLRAAGAEEPALAKGPPQKPSSLEVPAWESDLETLTLLYLLPRGSQNALSRKDARSRSPQARAGVPATATSAEEPGEGPAIQGPCRLQDSQLPEATTEVAPARAAPLSQAEDPPAAQGETEVALRPQGEAGDHDA